MGTDDAMPHPWLGAFALACDLGKYPHCGMMGLIIPES